MREVRPESLGLHSPALNYLQGLACPPRALAWRRRAEGGRSPKEGVAGRSPRTPHSRSPGLGGGKPTGLRQQARQSKTWLFEDIRGKRLLMGVPVPGGWVACRPTTPDSSTINAEGDRTVPSSVLKSTMQTADPIENVFVFYRRLLTRTLDNDVARGLKADVGRSVSFSDESEGRPFAFHVISVNSGGASTTLIVTRGENVEQARITWRRYLRHAPPECRCPLPRICYSSSARTIRHTHPWLVCRQRPGKRSCREHHGRRRPRRLLHVSLGSRSPRLRGTGSGTPELGECVAAGNWLKGAVPPTCGPPSSPCAQRSKNVTLAAPLRKCPKNRAATAIKPRDSRWKRGFAAMKTGQESKRLVL